MSGRFAVLLPNKPGFMGQIVPPLDLAYYTTFLGADTATYVKFEHSTDGYTERRSLRIRSIERNQYPNPHILRGTLQIDCNRPSEDAGDYVINVEVVFEVWSYPRTLVYSAESYRPATWALIKDLPDRAIFQRYEEGAPEQAYMKIGKILRPMCYSCARQAYCVATESQEIEISFPDEYKIVEVLTQ